MAARIKPEVQIRNAKAALDKLGLVEQIQFIKERIRTIKDDAGTFSIGLLAAGVCDALEEMEKAITEENDAEPHTITEPAVVPAA